MLTLSRTERLEAHSPRPRTALLAVSAASLLAVAGCKNNSESSNGAPDLGTVSPPAGTEAQALSDEEIADAVRRELSLDPTTQPPRIDVLSTEGVVHLTGAVPNLAAKVRATRLAETVRGVRTVSNRLTVETPDRPDESIEAEVSRALTMNPATDAYEVSVEVTEGHVTLTGEVQSWAEQRLCTKVTRTVRGVRSIENAIVLSTIPDRADAEIENDVQERLRWDVLVDDALIVVDAEDGTVKLDGVVGSAAEKRRAIADAWTAGVSDVEASDLEVQWWLARDDLRKNKYQPRTEEEIEAAVRDALLYDPRVRAYEVGANAEGGQVTLTGVVGTLEAKRAAQSLAENTVGVTSVRNGIEVRLPSPKSDMEIEGSVEMGLAIDAVTESYEIETEVEDGVVTLSGTVDNFYEKAQAEGVAAGVAGVVAVDNQLEVEDPTVVFSVSPYLYDVDSVWVTYRPLESVIEDAKLAEEIEDELFWSPFIDEDEVEVMVTDGVATLTGEVRTFHAKRAAAANAFEAGAVAVDNDVRVDPAL